MVPEASVTTVILAGPTATGKTELALELCQTHPNLEIINADSLLFYRGMSIGTAKPTPTELSKVPHHLIDIRNPDQPMTAADFARLARESLAAIQARGNQALLVGGSGFYLQALIYGVWDAPPSDPGIRQILEEETPEFLYAELEKGDPEAALRIGKKDRYRLIRAVEILWATKKSPTQHEAQSAKEPDPQFALYVVDREPDQLVQRIKRRTQQMLEQGLVEEFKAIQAKFPDARPLGAVGYKQVAHYLANTPPAGRKIAPGLEGLASEIELATRQLVKGQRTWFKSEPSARHFILDQDRTSLQDQLNNIYGA